ncbi:unnamed protein product [Caenorhabditis brenneri]
MDFKEKSPPDAEKSQKEAHIVHFVESKGHTYPTCTTKELKICAECHAVTNYRKFRTHLEKFHKEFSQSLMDRLVMESPRATCSKKTSMSPADMISLVPWSVRNHELFQQLNACSAEKRKQKQWKPNRNTWTNNMEYIKLSDFIVKKAKNNEECVPQYLEQLAKEYKEHSGSTWATNSIRLKIRNFEEAVHEMEEFDTDTKVKVIFMLSGSVDSGLLKKIRQTAHVELDEKNRITVYKSDTLNLYRGSSRSAILRAYFADKKRRMSQIHVKNENEKPKSMEVESETDEKAGKLTEIVDLTLDSEDQDQSEPVLASSTKSKLLESKSSNLDALSEKSRSESKKEKSGGSSKHSDEKSLVSKHPEPQNSIRKAPSVKSELSRQKTSIIEAPPSKSKLPGPKSSLTVAPPTSKPEKGKEDKSKNSDGKSTISKHPVPISKFFPKISKAPTAETKLMGPKFSDTRAPPTSESEEKEEDDSENSDESSNISEEESISEIEEPPKRQASGSKSENSRSESVKIQVSRCPTAPKSTDVSVESENEAENSENVTENSGCDEEDCSMEDEEDEKEESSDESSKNSEEESIAEIEEPPKRRVSDSESVNEAENSEKSELTENSDCDEEDVEECSQEDEEIEEEESEIHQTPPFRSEISNGNLSIPPNSHIRFLKSIMVFMSNLELRELDYLYERIDDRTLEIKERFAMDSEKEVSINEIRTCLMTCFLIVTKSATASTKSSVRTKESVRSQESWMSLTSFLKQYKRFVTSLKWKSLENFEQNLKSKIEELDEQDKRIPSSKVAFALQTIIEIVAP